MDIVFIDNTRGAEETSSQSAQLLGEAELRRLLIACLAGSLLAGLGSASVSADSGQATNLRMKQPSAGGEAYFSPDCPDSATPPPAGTVCHENYVIVFRETRVDGGGSNAPSGAPWSIFVTAYTLTFTDADGDVVISDQTFGFAQGDQVAASSDDQRVSSLTAVASVPMTDGSTFDFTGTWTGFGDRWVYSNNGPENDAEGIPRHYVDRCTTSNANAHQTGRNATMSGTVNGAPVHTYVAFPAGDIFYKHFVYITVTHGSCA